MKKYFDLLISHFICWHQLYASLVLYKNDWVCLRHEAWIGHGPGALIGLLKQILKATTIGKALECVLVVALEEVHLTRTPTRVCFLVSWKFLGVSNGVLSYFIWVLIYYSYYFYGSNSRVGRKMRGTSFSNALNKKDMNPRF